MIRRNQEDYDEDIEQEAFCPPPLTEINYLADFSEDHRPPGAWSSGAGPAGRTGIWGLAESGSRRQHLKRSPCRGARMTSISSSVATAEVRAAPKVKARNLSLDRARTFLTLVMLLHHSVIPYTYYGHTDPKEFFGFDMIVLATDSFFMAMFFFLSGLFVWPGIARKGPLGGTAAPLFPTERTAYGSPLSSCSFR